MKLSHLLIASLFLSGACQNENDNTRPVDDLGTGRQFIRMSLNGDYEKAEALLLKDSSSNNLSLYKSWEAMDQKLSRDEKRNYREADIMIKETRVLGGDSGTVISYYNSYDKKPAAIKVVKKDGQWWVDFTYTLLPQK